MLASRTPRRKDDPAVRAGAPVCTGEFSADLVQLIRKLQHAKTVPPPPSAPEEGADHGDDGDDGFLYLTFDLPTDLSGGEIDISVHGSQVLIRIAR
jgi:hypothetical protein